MQAKHIRRLSNKETLRERIEQAVQDFKDSAPKERQGSVWEQLASQGLVVRSEASKELLREAFREEYERLLKQENSFRP